VEHSSHSSLMYLLLSLSHLFLGVPAASIVDMMKLLNAHQLAVAVSRVSMLYCPFLGICYASDCPHTLYNGEVACNQPSQVSCNKA
jgi:hypothetical protein